ncbi:uncharacterized protein LOC126722424 [Quercus robur]|uniref:uncharacterized protein LOC126722424 n=1 Tax=Quercus robur TaxID=38942 RepID=UPI0021624D5E|nr:uncharacterized protein LOC126722424 [Quercus robur]
MKSGYKFLSPGMESSGPSTLHEVQAVWKKRVVLQLKKIKDKSYTGVSGDIGVYNPKVQEGGSSAAIYVLNGPENNLNTIITGWMSDGSINTGCYNANCAGFVQIDKSIYVGSPFLNIYIPNGPQLETSVSIVKDLDEGNWWISKDDINIGHFPSKLFQNLTKAETVGWGGVTVTTPNGISPPMGSRIFPDIDYQHISSFKNIWYKNEIGLKYGPYRDYIREIIVDNLECYGLDYNGYQGIIDEYTFEFGGPGGQCGN